MTGRENEDKKSSAPRLDTLAMINKIAAEEGKLSSAAFLAPVVAGGGVAVRVSGIVYKMSLDNSQFEGWGLLKMVSPKRATVFGAPSLDQIGAYMKLLPRFRMVALGQFNDKWWALQASTADSRFQIDGPVPVQLTQRVAAFETICARFDGSAFWFESTDRRRNPSISRSLRQALQDDINPSKLQVSGAIPQERLAYKMLWLQKHPEAGGVVPGEPTDAQRIEQALQHAGATLEGFWNIANDHVSVRYLVDGQTHVSEVRPSDLSVISAGICLSGMDADFDLTSLVGVMREGGYPNDD